MEKKDQEIIEKVIEVTEKIDIPEKLKPEQMERYLQETRKKKKGWKKSYCYGLVTACSFLIVSATIFTMNRFNDIPKEEVEKTIAIAKSYDEIYKYIKKDIEQNKSYQFGKSLSVAESKLDTTLPSKAQGDTALPDSGKGNYSDTNIRQEGVAEGDYVKTDGTYLYVLKENDSDIVIIDVKNNNMKEVATISLEKTTRVTEFYVAKDRLIVLSSRQKEQKSSKSYNLQEYTEAITFDISNPSDPIKLGSVSQSGSYYSSRMVGDYVYIFSQFYAYSNIKKSEIETYIPQIQGEVISQDDIYMSNMPYGNMYTIISSFDVTNPKEVIDSKAIFSDSDTLYVSNENIYTYAQVYGDSQKYTQTQIRKISYKDGRLNGVAQIKVNGTLDSTFCMDEYNGNLRLAVTIQQMSMSEPAPFYEEFLPFKRSKTIEKIEGNSVSNAVYILNDQLQIVGEIKDIAKGERIYSARFLGEIGYFVTYRETDPLFSVDLSNPQSPKIIGALKIPGFSEYLHFYGEDKLLGIGQDMDEQGVTSKGVKISMFDISDPSNVQEEQKQTIEGAYSSDAFYDYKSVLVDVNKNIIGFSVQAELENYYVFSYDKSKGFITEMVEEVNGNSYKTVRGIYINNILYIVKGGIVESYNMDNYEKLKDLVL